VLTFILAETVLNYVWDTHTPVPTTYPVLAVAPALLLVGLALAGQALMWHLGVTGMEAKLNKIKQAEAHAAAQAEDQARRAEEELSRRQREQSLEDQRRRNQLAQEQEQQRLDKERLHMEEERKQRERQENEEIERKAREEQDRCDAQEQARREEQTRQDIIRRESQRKMSLEQQGLPYYPPPTTRYRGRNAEEWYNAAMLRTTSHTEAEAALTALKEEGTPFLLDSLGRQQTTAGVRYMLRLINIDYVHPNDLPKVIACVKNRRWSNSTRLEALRLLQKLQETHKYRRDIETAVSDLLLAPGSKAEVTEILRSMKK
jgi:hypothetical protein